MDDTDEDKHFAFLKEKCLSDNRIIGNVKNEAISLCRGKYVLEMDHDDAYNIFKQTTKLVLYMVLIQF